MRCEYCNFYKREYMWNQCSLLEVECFHTTTNCLFVNDDQTVNKEEFEKAFGNELNVVEDIDKAVENFSLWVQDAFID